MAYVVRKKSVAPDARPRKIKQYYNSQIKNDEIHIELRNLKLRGQEPY
jgi:hypothetical protein